MFLRLFLAAVFFILPALSRSAESGPLAPVLQSFVEKEIVAGVVALVADRDGVRAVEKAGVASLAARTPLREEAVFWIASISKALTGVAVMMLVDEGKLQLDDPVEKFLPEFHDQQVEAPGIEMHPPAHPITLREIMSHTSGLVLSNEKTLKRTGSLRDDVAQYAAHSLRQEPGTKYEYNNCGINTAGRIIEVVSGMPYADFLQQRLLDPLGMKDTTCWPNAEQAARLARSARLGEDGRSLVEVKLDANVAPALIAKLSRGAPVPPTIIAEMGGGIAADYGQRYAMPAGGYFSTAHDLGRFGRMLLRGGELDGRRFLSEAAVRTLATSQTGEAKVSPAETYGVGFSIKRNDAEGASAGSFGHRGARRPALWIDPKNGLAMVILVARFDMPGEQQATMYGGFMRAAIAAFGSRRGQ